MVCNFEIFILLYNPANNFRKVRRPWWLAHVMESQVSSGITNHGIPVKQGPRISTARII